MIRFGDVQNKMEISEAQQSVEGFRDIKPVSDISKAEESDFWERIFAEPIGENEITETDIVAEVYGRSESEFSFDFDVQDSEVQNLLSRFQEPTWSEMSMEEQKCVISDFANILGRRLEIAEQPEIEFYVSSPNDCGCFDPDKNVIRVNQMNFDTPQEIVDTVAHEMRHAYQYERVQKMENHEDFLYAYNFANYIAPIETVDGYANFIEYQDQLVEAEARAFANMFVIGEEVRHE